MTDTGSSDQPDDTMRGRVPESSRKLWVLLSVDRTLLAAAVLAVVFAALVVVGALDPVPLRESVASDDPIETLFQALVTAIVTGVTLVVTIGQLVLSQELGAVGDQRDRMEGATSFVRDVEAVVDEPVAPAAPAAFLAALVTAARSRSEDLAGAVDDASELGEAVEGFVGDLQTNADRVVDRLSTAEFGTFDVLYAALDFNYSWKIHEARRLRAEYADELPTAADQSLAALVETLELFGPAREHVKTLYFQWELINLSRAVLYAAVPALVVCVSMLLYVADTGTVTGTLLGVDSLVWVVAGAATVGLSPFALLLSYILRIATVAKRTLAIGPFVLRGDERTEGGRDG